MRATLRLHKRISGARIPCLQDRGNSGTDAHRRFHSLHASPNTTWTISTGLWSSPRKRGDRRERGLTGLRKPVGTRRTTIGWSMISRSSMILLRSPPNSRSLACGDASNFTGKERFVSPPASARPRGHFGTPKSRENCRDWGSWRGASAALGPWTSCAVSTTRSSTSDVWMASLQIFRVGGGRGTANWAIFRSITPDCAPPPSDT